MAMKARMHAVRVACGDGSDSASSPAAGMDGRAGGGDDSDWDDDDFDHTRPIEQPPVAPQQQAKSGAGACDSFDDSDEGTPAAAAPGRGGGGAAASRPPWALPLPAPAPDPARLAEFDALTPAAAFAAPLCGASDLREKAYDLWPAGGRRDDVLLLYATGVGYLGKLLISDPCGGSWGDTVTVRWVTWNSFFPFAGPLPLVSAGECSVQLADEDGAPGPTWLDLVLGGASVTPLQVRDAVRACADGLAPLRPDIGLAVRGGGCPCLIPARGFLLHPVALSAAPHPLPALLARAAAAPLPAPEPPLRYTGGGGHDHMVGPVYHALWRRVADVSHFTPPQLADLFADFADCAGQAGHPAAGGAELLLDRQSFARMVLRTLPVDGFIPPLDAGADPQGDEAREGRETAAVVGKFLRSERVVDGLWSLCSDPPGAYLCGPPPAGEGGAARVVRFRRFVDVLGVAVFGKKDDLIELLVALLLPEGKTAVTVDELISFLSAFLPVEEEEQADLAEQFASWFTKEPGTGRQVACAGALRRGIAAVPAVSTTWRALLGPHHGPGREKKWDFSNPRLA